MPRTMDPFFGDGVPGLQPILIHGIWDHNIPAGFGIDFFTCFPHLRWSYWSIPCGPFFFLIFSVVLRACQDFRGDELWPRQRLCGTARVREKKGLPWRLGGCDTSWLWFPRSKPQQADTVEPDQPAEPQKAAIHWGFTWIHQVSRCFFSESETAGVLWPVT